MACKCCKDDATCCSKNGRGSADTSSATDRAVKALGLVSPLLATTLKVAPTVLAAKDKLAPAADTAKDRIQSSADTARERIVPLADQARKTAAHKVAPVAATAAVGAASLASNAKDQVQPHLEDLADRVQPTVDAAREKVVDELLPQLLDLLRQAENHPAVAEASKRGQAAAAALRGDLELPEQKQKGSVAGTVAKLALAGAAAAAAAVAVRQFLASKDDAWTAHQPSSAYTSGSAAGQNAPAPAAASGVAKESADEGKDGEVPESGPFRASTVPANPDVDGTVAPDAAATWVDHTDAPASDVVTEPNPHEAMSAEGGPVREHETTNEDLAVLNTFGEGSYVGEEPPAEYTIKGNERSMKYHTADSAGYDRSIADVWFSSAEAAERAGFTRA